MSWTEESFVYQMVAVTFVVMVVAAGKGGEEGGGRRRKRKKLVVREDVHDGSGLVGLEEAVAGFGIVANGVDLGV